MDLPLFSSTNDEVEITLITHGTALGRACDNAIGASNGIGIRAFITERTVEIATTSHSTNPANEHEVSRSIRQHNDTELYRNNLAEVTETHLLVSPEHLLASSSVIGHGYCGPTALFLATSHPDQQYRFIITSNHTELDVIREVTEAMVARVPVANAIAINTFSHVECTRFQVFLQTYISMGRAGHRYIPAEFWPPPHFLALLSDVNVAFWVQEQNFNGCYLQMGDIYDGYSHKLQALIDMVPALRVTPQIRLIGQHYEPIYSISIKTADVTRAFGRLADRLRTIVTGLTDIPLSQQSENE
jgi:hypothetical protein